MLIDNSSPKSVSDLFGASPQNAFKHEILARKLLSKMQPSIAFSFSNFIEPSPRKLSMFIPKDDVSTVTCIFHQSTVSAQTLRCVLLRPTLPVKELPGVPVTPGDKSHSACISWHVTPSITRQASLRMHFVALSGNRLSNLSGHVLPDFATLH